MHLLATLDPDLSQLIIGIISAVIAFFGVKQGSKRRD